VLISFFPRGRARWYSSSDAVSTAEESRELVFRVCGQSACCLLACSPCEEASADDHGETRVQRVVSRRGKVIRGVRGIGGGFCRLPRVVEGDRWRARRAEGSRPDGNAGSDAYGVGSSCVEAHEAGACKARRASVRVGGQASAAEHTTGEGLRVVAGVGCCILSRCARGSSWVSGAGVAGLRGLAAAVILCSGAQGHGRQVSTVRAVAANRTMWKASRSVPEVSGANDEEDELTNTALPSSWCLRSPGEPQERSCPA